MYHPAYGKEFRPKKLRTNQLHAHEAAINLRFQRYPDGHAFEDTRPDWLREQHKPATRLDSPSRLGYWELEWVPHQQGRHAGRSGEEPANTQKNVWLKGKLVLPKRPTANTVASLLSTSVTPLHPLSDAKIGQGLYFGDEIRPATRPGASHSHNASNARTPVRHTRPDTAHDSHEMTYPAHRTRPFSALEKHTQTKGLWEERSGAVAGPNNRMPSRDSQSGMRPFTAIPHAGKRGGSHTSAGSSSVATSTVVQRLK
jgi:hypothetical protein